MCMFCLPFDGVPRTAQNSPWRDCTGHPCSNRSQRPSAARARTSSKTYLRGVDGGVRPSSIHERGVRQPVPEEEKDGAELGERLNLLHLAWDCQGGHRQHENTTSVSIHILQHGLKMTAYCTTFQTQIGVVAPE